MVLEVVDRALRQGAFDFQLRGFGGAVLGTPEALRLRSGQAPVVTDHGFIVRNQHDTLIGHGTVQPFLRQEGQVPALPRRRERLLRDEHAAFRGAFVIRTRLTQGVGPVGCGGAFA